MSFDNISFNGEENIKGNWYYVFEDENYNFIYFSFNEDTENHNIIDEYGNSYTWSTTNKELLNLEFYVNEDLDPYQESQRLYLDENQSKILKQICQNLI